MTWTYTNSPATIERDEVRLLVGDTDSNDPQLTDEEVAYFISEEGSVGGAALAAVRALIAKFARLVNKSVGDLSLGYGQRLANYEVLETRLLRRANLRLTGPVATGLSVAAKEAVDADTDRVQPAFKRDQFSDLEIDDERLSPT